MIMIITIRNVSDVDLFVGGLFEKPLPGALLGPTFACIVREQVFSITITITITQMTRTRAADRFFYSNEGGARPLNNDQVDLQIACFAFSFSNPPLNNDQIKLT